MRKVIIIGSTVAAAFIVSFGWCIVVYWASGAPLFVRCQATSDLLCRAAIGGTVCALVAWVIVACVLSDVKPTPPSNTKDWPE